MKYKLQKDNNVKNINCTQKQLSKRLSIIAMSFILGIHIRLLSSTSTVQDIKYNFYNLINKDEKFLPDRRNECLNDAKDIIEKKFNKELLENYYNNVKTLKYYYNSNDVLKEDVLGYYDSSYNRIIEIYDNKSVYYHEFSHMISRKDKDNVGFRKKDIGNGLNEGYTELFCHKYFGDLIGEESYKLYPYEIMFSEQLVNILGIEKMNEIFLTANQDMLIDELTKIYGTKKDAYDLLKSIDKLNKEEDNKKALEYSKDIYYKILHYSYAKALEISNQQVNVRKKIFEPLCRLKKALNIDNDFEVIILKEILDSLCDDNYKYKYGEFQNIKNVYNIFNLYYLHFTNLELDNKVYKILYS